MQPESPVQAARPGATTPLRVGGFVPFTATDYPDALAAVVFCQGCPWICAYCHNPHLRPARGEDEHDFARIVDWLGTRRGLLDAVVFSGGEPTAQAALAGALETVRGLGYAIGLHTGGAYPRRLAQVLPQVDWVGLDVKAPGAHYASVTGVTDSGNAALASLDLVLAAGVGYEVRTTIHPDVSPPDVLERLARELAARGISRWILQPFRPTGCASVDLVAAAPSGVTLAPDLLARLSAHVPVIEVRG
ncbi:MAG: anaerobic ribonucleoside-triphosphate reductase activating protein [Burkholderiales bacterium]